ncbi:MAG: WbqC family protein [Bacteroidota bacterium]
MEAIATPQPLLFAPPIGWYAGICNVDALILADEIQIERQTLRNRLVYGTFQGSKLFTIPLVNATLKNKYREVEISYAEKWTQQLVNALQTAYGKSPFFEYYGYRFEAIITSKEPRLWDLNLKLLLETLKCLKLPIELKTQESSLMVIDVPEFTTNYYQVFSEKITFMKGLSILDLLFNEGPDSAHILGKKA